MTGLPARIFGLKNRGTIAAGSAADLVAFDLASISDSNDYLNPSLPPSGIEWVMVNGERVVERTMFLGIRNGVRLRPEGK